MIRKRRSRQSKITSDYDYYSNKDKRHNIYKCKSDPKKGLYFLSRSRGTYAQFAHDDYVDEVEYISKLSDDEKIWLETFFNAYYGIAPKAMKELDMPIEARRSRYNQHKGSKNDIYNKCGRVSYSEGNDYTKEDEETND